MNYKVTIIKQYTKEDLEKELKRTKMDTIVYATNIIVFLFETGVR